MANPQITSLVVRLQHARALEASDALEELLKFPEAIGEVVPVVEKRIEEGIVFSTSILAKLFSAAHSATLYQRVRDPLLKDHWATLKLYESRYPDPEIEKQLCDKLYEVAGNDAEPLRSAIVEAMGKVGSDAVLPTLEAILFDLEPSAKIRETFAGSLGLVGAFEAKSRSEFVRRVALAIEEIQRRATGETAVAGGSTDEPVQDENETNNAERAQTQAQRYLDESPELVLMIIRRGAEALAKDLYRRLGHEQNGKPARKMTLEELLKPVRDSDAPEPFKLLVHTFQLFGNFAAHDQDDQHRFVTKKMAEALLALYEEALLIYTEWSAKAEPLSRSNGD